MRIFINKSFLKRAILNDRINTVNFLKKFQKFSFSTNKLDQDIKRNKKDEDQVDNEEDNYSLLNITIPKLVKLKKDTEENIIEGEYNLSQVPTPNYFGEIPIYIAPQDYFSKRMNIEVSGFTLISSITVLNFFGLLYPPSLIYYFGFLTLASVFKLATKGGQEGQVILMTLVDEKNVRVVYLSGKEEVVQIKNLVYQLDDKFNSFLLQKDDNPKRFSKRESTQTSEPKRLLGISVLIDNKRKMFILRNNILNRNNSPNNSLAFANLPLLMGIINRKTKRINFNLDLNKQSTSN